MDSIWVPIAVIIAALAAIARYGWNERKRGREDAKRQAEEKAKEGVDAYHDSRRDNRDAADKLRDNDGRWM